MDSITVKIPVTIKAKLTEKLRNRIVDELKQSIQNIDLELQQIEREEKRVIQEQAQSDLRLLQEIRQHFAIEKQKRIEFKEQAEAKLQDTNKLALGAEIVQGNLERLAMMKVGDNIREFMNVEVLVEDDKIIAIRS